MSADTATSTGTSTGTTVRQLKTAIPGPKSRELHAAREKQVSSGFGITSPIFIDHVEGSLLVDVDGNTLVDFASGIAVTSVGAANPKVAEAVAAQAKLATHTCFMVTEYQGFVDVCEKLNQLTPGDFDKRSALFTSGAEAIENAVKIARAYTGRPAIVVLDHAYHGRTHMTMTMTAKNVPYKQSFGPFAGEVYRTPNAYGFRWPSGREHAATEALAALKEMVLTQIGAGNVACIVAEPIAGEGGFIAPEPGFLKGVQDFAREHGIVFVADEIQTGFARTGTLFASEFEGIEPDLITTAKALGGGMPISAVTGRAEMMNAAPVGGIGGTYAGNPVACAAALATIEVIESEDLVGRAKQIESIALPRLQGLVETSPYVGEARGRGAMLAIEFVTDDGITPNPDAAKKVAAHANSSGVLTLTCGTFGNVIRLLPPLVITDEELNEGLDVITEGVKAL